ncbi:hypothetical protein NFJ02_27g63250 [Pycnococcus provasolii]
MRVHYCHLALRLCDSLPACWKTASAVNTLAARKVNSPPETSTRRSRARRVSSPHPQPRAEGHRETLPTCHHVVSTEVILCILNSSLDVSTSVRRDSTRTP